MSQRAQRGSCQGPVIGLGGRPPRLAIRPLDLMTKFVLLRGEKNCRRWRRGCRRLPGIGGYMLQRSRMSCWSRRERTTTTHEARLGPNTADRKTSAIFFTACWQLSDIWSGSSSAGMLSNAYPQLNRSLMKKCRLSPSPLPKGGEGESWRSGRFMGSMWRNIQSVGGLGRLKKRL